MDKTKQPGIIIKSILLAEEQFHRNPNIPNNTEMRVNFSRNTQGNGTDHILQITVNIELLAGHEKVLNLKSTFIGIFTQDEQNKNMNMSEFIVNNAPAIMFPYIREHITSTTQKAAVQPIILPPINLVALFENDKSKDEKTENK